MYKSKLRLTLVWILIFSILFGLLSTSYLAVIEKPNETDAVDDFEQAPPAEYESFDYRPVSGMGNKSGNILNGGFTALYNGDIYVIENAYQNNLFRNGSVISADVCSYLNVIDDFIYYIASGNNMEIVKCGLNGENRIVLYSAQDALLSNLMIKDDAVYFIENNERIIKMIDGAPQILLDGSNLNDFALLGEGVVFSESTYIENSDEDDIGGYESHLKVDVFRALYFYDGSEKLLISDSILSYDVTGDSVYYSNAANGDLYSTSIANGVSTPILNGVFAENLFCDDAIYFISNTDNFLYTVDYGSSVTAIVSEEELRLFNISGDFFAFPLNAGKDERTASVHSSQRNIVLLATEPYLWPVKTKVITSWYGVRTYNGKTSMHNGIDIGAVRGSAVKSTLSGKVVEITNSCSHDFGKSYNCCKSQGNCVIIQNDNGTYSYYMHLKQNSITVSINKWYPQGTQIAESASTGYSGGPHLHFAFSTKKWGGYTSANPSNPASAGFTRSGGTYVPHSDGKSYVFEPGIVIPDVKPVTLTQKSYIGGKEITLSTAESGAAIYYTTDGSDPANSGTRKTSPNPFNVTSTTTVKAIATKNGYNPSKLSESVTVTKLEAPKIATTLNPEGILITMSQVNGAEIRYTTDGTDPLNGTYEVYKGGFVVTSNANMRARAVKTGFANSDITMESVIAAAPETPSARLVNTASKVAVGTAVNVGWDKVAAADRYEAKLLKNGIEIQTETTDGTIVSFILPEAGAYEIVVTSVNFIGASAGSFPPLTVEAMPPCKLTFVDSDGTVISETEVPYGEKTPSVYPKNPSRVGHDFLAWSVPSGTVVYADTEIKATYKIKEYNVRFYDVKGEQIGPVQQVEYGSSAVAPTEDKVNLNDGYKFAGWSISPDSTGTNMLEVDGDMRLYASQTWENVNLPVLAEIVGFTRWANAGGYDVDVKLTHAHENYTQGKILVSVKTSNGKMVANTVHDTVLYPKKPGTTDTYTVKVSTPDLASVAEAVVVGFANNITGGALSNLVSSSDLSAGKNWSEPSEWSTDIPPEGTSIESKEQIRVSTRETNTSTTSDIMPGWIYYGFDAQTGAWSAWSQTKPAEMAGRTIQSRYIDPVYKTQYNYWGFKDSKNRYHFCAGAGKNYYGTTFSKIESGWRDTTLPFTSQSGQACGGFSSSACWHWYNNPRKVTINGYYKLSSTYYYWVNTRQTQTGGGYYEYRYQDTSNTYYFYRYTDWSDWRDSDTAYASALEAQTLARESQIQAVPVLPEGVPLTKTEKRTVYRYRTEIEYSGPVTETEDHSGITYTVTGNLNLNEDLNGRKATILVYRKMNADPITGQRQFIGQTTIGSENAYEFSFITAKAPDETTGDYVVSLALEGADRVVDVEVIGVPKSAYTVTFVMDDGVTEIPVYVDGEPLTIDKNGVTHYAQKVHEGELAIIPETPEKPGHYFAGWKDSSTNNFASSIYWDTTLSAVFIPYRYPIVLVDFANDTVVMDSVRQYGEEIGTLPNPNVPEGKVFKGWYTLNGNNKTAVNSDTIVTDNTLIIADWDTKTYTVTFTDKDGNAVSIQTIAHGSAATPPEQPEAEGMVFSGWSVDSAWWNVTMDMEVRSIFHYSQTTEAPVVSTEQSFEDVVNIVLLKSSTPESTIYYNIESTTSSSTIYAGGETECVFWPNGVNNEGYDYTHLFADDEPTMPVGFTAVYSEDNPIKITEDTRITFMAVADGMNDSETIVMDIPFISPDIGEDFELSDKLLYAESVSTYAGQTVEIPVYATNLDGVGNVSLSLKYDSTVLTRTGTSTAEGIENITIPQSTYETDDSGNGLLLTKLEFYVLPGARPGDYQIDITPIAKDLGGSDVHIDGTTAFIIITPTDGDFTVSGIMKSYNPSIKTTLRLLQDGIEKHLTTIEATTGSGIQEQAFSFDGVSEGVYTLEITKERHAKVTINNIIVDNSGVDLTKSANPDVSIITLPCGDMTGDGEINQLDLNLLWQPSVYGKKVSNGADLRCDLNGDGEINQSDLNILWQPSNYNKGASVIN